MNRRLRVKIYAGEGMEDAGNLIADSDATVSVSPSEQEMKSAADELVERVAKRKGLDVNQLTYKATLWPEVYDDDGW